MSHEETRRALLAHVIASGRVASLAPFAADLARFALLVVAPTALASFAQRPEAAAMLTCGHLGRVRVEGVGSVELALVPRARAEGAIGELNRATAPHVGFGEVRVVVLDAHGFTFGTIAIAPSTSGVLA